MSSGTWDVELLDWIATHDCAVGSNKFISKVDYNKKSYVHRHADTDITREESLRIAIKYAMDDRCECISCIAETDGV